MVQNLLLEISTRGTVPSCQAQLTCSRGGLASGIARGIGRGRERVRPSGLGRTKRGLGAQVHRCAGRSWGWGVSCEWGLGSVT